MAAGVQSDEVTPTHGLRFPDGLPEILNFSNPPAKLGDFPFLLDPCGCGRLSWIETLRNTKPYPAKTSSRTVIIVCEHVFLALQGVSDQHIIRDIDVLPMGAFLGEPCATADIDPVPDARSFADLGAFVDDGGGMNL